jgi:hypothetical protein
MSSKKKNIKLNKMNGKYITTQIRITSLSHRNNKKTLEPKAEKVADLSEYVIVWKKGKARQEEMQVLSEY